MLNASAPAISRAEVDEELSDPSGDSQSETPSSLFDLRPARPPVDLGLGDRQVTDIAWGEHVAEKFVSTYRREVR
jgi:hypothetical protein